MFASLVRSIPPSWRTSLTKPKSRTLARDSQSNRMSLPMALFVYGQNLPLLTQVSRGWISSMTSQCSIILASSSVSKMSAMT